MKADYVACPTCPVRGKAIFRPFSGDELKFVTALKFDHMRVPAREHIVQAGTNGGILYTLYSGWAFRYKAMPGGRRQVLDFLLPGDLIGLQSPLTGTVRHGVCAVTDVIVCALHAQPFRSVFDAQPRLATALVTTLVLDEERADTRLALLGRQRSTQRLAYLLLELHARLLERDLADACSAEFPLTYDVMADALGLSRAQLARSLVEIRARDFATIRDNELRLHDVESMARYCEFESIPAGQLRAII